jgi:PIN domain nuclease of toxin-antitoxin system
MNYLLDTCTFLWTIAKSKNLSEIANKAVKNPNNEIFISAVSLWEIAIKCRIGKLDLGGLEPEELLGIAEKMEFQLIGLSPEESSTYGNLNEATHKDPFDRMLIWQAIQRKIILISKDHEFSKFEKYGLKLLW